MFEPRRHRNKASSAAGLLELIYVTTVRDIRTGPGSGMFGLLSSILQMAVLIAIFFFVFSLLGLRSVSIRGDFMLFVMSGVFLFITHIKAVSAVFGSEGPTSPMMKHAPMNTVVAIFGAALSSLYIQALAVFVILSLYHAAYTPITIDRPVAAFGCLLLAWFSGCAVGLLLLAAKPWAPEVVRIIRTVYMRANMLASGKMFVANSLPGFMLPWFDWNPLFHAIDQARGFTFINYNPHFSSVTYPIYVALGLIMVGLMAEFVTRRSASLSWNAR
jgi:ABC-type polysaccharide/polyol phosphate export permease